MTIAIHPHRAKRLEVAVALPIPTEILITFYQMFARAH